MSLKRQKVKKGLQILVSSCMTRMNTRHVKTALILYLSGVRNTKYGNQVLSWNCVSIGSEGEWGKGFSPEGSRRGPELPGNTGALLSLRHRVWLGAIWSQGLGVNDPYGSLSTWNILYVFCLQLISALIDVKSEISIDFSWMESNAKSMC